MALFRALATMRVPLFRPDLALARAGRYTPVIDELPARRSSTSIFGARNKEAGTHSGEWQSNPEGLGRRSAGGGLTLVVQVIGAIASENSPQSLADESGHQA